MLVGRKMFFILRNILVINVNGRLIVELFMIFIRNTRTVFLIQNVIKDLG